MEKDLARLVATTAFRAAADLTDLLQLLKGNCSPADYDVFSKRLASSSANISLTVLEPIFEEHPTIREEFEARIQKYGRIF